MGQGKGWLLLPTLFVFADFPGAQVVAVVFKVLAVVIIAIGTLAAVEVARSSTITGNDRIASVAGVIGGTIIAAAAMAFFGYVLQLLVAIHYDVRFVESAKRAAQLQAQPNPTAQR